MLPHQFPRRILLCVTGTTPQIITETLYALAVETEGRPPFIPTEVRVLTTAKGAEQARLSLLAEDRNMFGRLCQEHGLEGIHFDADCIEVFRDARNRPMDDIMTPDDNERAADHITRTVAELTRDSKAAIHASIAGGRKTMGFYLGYAMSLFGREQDRVSHVLVSEGFESHRDFFYKPIRPATLKNLQGWEMSTADARIHLAHIPIVRLGGHEFEALSERRLGFADAVARANRIAGGAELVLRVKRLGWDEDSGKAILGGEPLDLSPVEVLVLHWFAVRRIKDQDEAGWIEREALEYAIGASQNRGYLEEIHALSKQHAGHAKARLSFEKSFDIVTDSNAKACSNIEVSEEKMPKPRKVPNNWLGPLISVINRKIRKVLGQTGVTQYGIETKGKRKGARYRLALAPDRVRIE